ncbi:MAG: hypothetical protein ACYC5Q_02550 [Thermoleophilia bacterium]|jgi:hypothetical protein
MSSAIGAAGVSGGFCRASAVTADAADRMNIVDETTVGGVSMGAWARAGMTALLVLEVPPHAEP